MDRELDISVERTIPASPDRVAAVMFDPTRDPEWMKALTGAELLDAPLAPGSRARRTARFLGRSIGWTTVVQQYSPPGLLVLDIVDGPFVGRVTYEITASEVGATVRIRNVGRPGTFRWLPSSLMRRAVRSSLAGDLAHLEAVVTS